MFYTTDNGAWQDVYPDAGYTPFRGTKGTLREGGNRVPAIAWMPGKIAANTKNHEIVGGLDLMATFASVGGVRLPTQDRANQPTIFDSYDMSPVLFGTGKSRMQCPPRKLQSKTYAGTTISEYEKFQHVREQLSKQGFIIGVPAGN